MSDGDACVRAGASAMHRWQQAGRAALLSPVPAAIFDTALIRLGLRREPGLAHITRSFVWIIEDWDRDCPEIIIERLLLSLGEIADASEPALLKNRAAEGEVNRKYVVEHLHLRSWCALLARKLEPIVLGKWNHQSPILERWAKIRETSVLPEIRNA